MRCLSWSCGHRGFGDTDEVAWVNKQASVHLVNGTHCDHWTSDVEEVNVKGSG